MWFADRRNGQLTGRVLALVVFAFNGCNINIKRCHRRCGPISQPAPWSPRWRCATKRTRDSLKGRRCAGCSRERERWSCRAERTLAGAAEWSSALSLLLLSPFLQVGTVAGHIGWLRGNEMDAGVWADGPPDEWEVPLLLLECGTT